MYLSALIKALLFILLSCLTAFGQTGSTPAAADSAPQNNNGNSVDSSRTKTKWYDRIAIRGYTQIRYNGLFETNPELRCEQCDRSWGGGGGFFIRRSRIIFSGQIHRQVYFYIQPDFASTPQSSTLNFVQLRDAYLDVGIDANNEFRIRLGQSKIPYGFENMQSSSNRLPLDRNDALNSALANERDLGMFFYWAPSFIRQRFSNLVDDELKGSGDYGVLGIGIFNGQTANRPELNTNRHIVARLTYPFAIGSQIIEPSIQGYTGYFVIPQDQISPGVKTQPANSYLDQRVAATFVLYPKPIGIQAEYNIGRGPEFDPQTSAIETKNLKGGYATFTYFKQVRNHLIYPFFRLQYYQGGKKHEQDARRYRVQEQELGIEWQPSQYLELVATYIRSRRRFEDFEQPINYQAGSLLRLQVQLNF